MLLGHFLFCQIKILSGIQRGLLIVIDFSENGHILLLGRVAVCVVLRDLDDLC